jgi:hypothetical protein
MDKYISDLCKTCPTKDECMKQCDPVMKEISLNKVMSLDKETEDYFQKKTKDKKYYDIGMGL